MEYILIFISAIFVNNIVLSQFLGICPFLGVSKKIDTALGMGAAVAFVLTLSTIVTYLVQIYILNPFGLQYLQTLAFILVIAALVQMVEIILKKVSQPLYQALGIFLPLITSLTAPVFVCFLKLEIYSAETLDTLFPKEQRSFLQARAKTMFFASLTSLLAQRIMEFPFI
mgnify:CR=1 FL=1